MTRLVLGLALLSVMATRAAAAPRGSGPAHPFGLGLQLGAPTGLTAKLYLNQPFALQMGLGFVDDFDDEDGLHVHLDFIWHPAILAREAAFTLPFYLGVGARVLQHDYVYRIDRTYYVDEDTHLGVRVPIGLLMDFNRVRLDIFLEVALVIDFIFLEDRYGPEHRRHDRVDLNGGLGIRYYF
jgi:hypothetical protein